MFKKNKKRNKGKKILYTCERRLIDTCCQWTSFQADGDSFSNTALELGFEGAGKYV